MQKLLNDTTHRPLYYLKNQYDTRTVVKYIDEIICILNVWLVLALG